MAVTLTAGSARAIDPDCLRTAASDGIARVALAGFKANQEAVQKNFELMGIARNGPASLNRSSLGLLFEHGVMVPGGSPTAQLELAEILCQPHAGLPELRKHLDDWATRHGVGYKFAFPADIDKKANEYFAKGLIASDQGVAPNGFVQPDLYAQLARDGYYPIADPHDVTSHVASLTDPVFRRNFGRMVAQLNELEGKLGRASPILIRGMRDSDDVAKQGYSRLWGHLSQTVRDSTHENWTYLVKDAQGKPRLFMQGNSTFNAITLDWMVAGQANDTNFVIRLLNRGGDFSTAPGRIPNYATEDLDELRSIGVYLKQPGAQARYDRYKRALVENGMDREAQGQASEKLRGFVAAKRRELDQGFGSPRPYTETEVQKLLQDLAVFIDRDPQLSRIFSQASKQELFEAAMEFTEDYQKFLDRYVEVMGGGRK